MPGKLPGREMDHVPPGGRAGKKELRGVPKQFALAAAGELFDRAYLYVRETTSPQM